jgi:transposase-like protein
MGSPYATSGGDIEEPGEIMPVTNAIESINARMRKIIKTRGHFPGDDAAYRKARLGPFDAPH